MKNKLVRIGLGVIAATVLVAVWMIMTFKMPAVTRFKGFEVGKLTGKELNATAKIALYNPNFYALKASNLSYMVTYQDTVLGTGSISNTITIAGNDTTVLDLPVILELQGIFANHKSLLRKAKFELETHVDGTFTNLGIAHSLEIKTNIEPRKFLKDVLSGSMGDSPVSFESISWKTSSLSASSFSFVSAVKNPVDVDMVIESLEIGLFEMDKPSSEVGSWKLDSPIPLPAKGKARVPATIQISHYAAGKGMITSIFSGEIQYKTIGKLVMKLADLPFEIPIEGILTIQPASGTGSWEPLDDQTNP